MTDPAAPNAAELLLEGPSPTGYAATASELRAAGWDPLPLPPGKKYPPPDGFTGWRGRRPTDLDIDRWARGHPDANVAIRLPHDVVGVDVDVYRGGAEGLAQLEAAHGPLPPTVMSTSRHDGSGIRLYRVPVRTILQSAPAPGIEICQTHHRYVVCPPSTHPEDRQYRWADSRTGDETDLPVVDELPELPWAWIDGLRSERTNGSTQPATPDAAQAFLDGHTENLDAARLQGLRTQLAEAHAAGRSRHDTFRDVACEAMREAAAGCYPARDAVDLLLDWWGQVMDDPQRIEEEPGRMLLWAIGQAEGEPGRVAEIRQTLPAAWIDDLDSRTPDTVDEAPDLLGIFTDWPAFWAHDHAAAEWIYPDVFARSRGHAIYAARKAKKSLFVLHAVAQLATGPDPIAVVYLDYEMTSTDLYERLGDMGYGPDTDLTRLHYATLPALPPLDTREGGQAITAIVEAVAAQHPDHHLVVIIDTTSRAVEGEENSADTIRAFYRHTGAVLKRTGCTWARIDHAGKDPTRGQRGSSAKGDDVDIVWRITPTDNGIRLHRDLARMSWVPDRLDYAFHDDPVTFTRTNAAYPAGTGEVATALDQLDVPTDATGNAAFDALKAAGQGRQRKLVLAAQQYRRTEWARHQEESE